MAVVWLKESNADTLVDVDDALSIGKNFWYTGAAPNLPHTWQRHCTRQMSLTSFVRILEKGPPYSLVGGYYEASCSALAAGRWAEQLRFGSYMQVMCFRRSYCSINSKALRALFCYIYHYRPSFHYTVLCLFCEDEKGMLKSFQGRGRMFVYSVI